LQAPRSLHWRTRRRDEQIAPQGSVCTPRARGRRRGLGQGAACNADRQRFVTMGPETGPTNPMLAPGPKTKNRGVARATRGWLRDPEQRCYKGLNKQLRCNGTPYREATTAGSSKNEPHLEQNRTEVLQGLSKQLRCNGTPYREATTAGSSKNEPHLDPIQEEEEECVLQGTYKQLRCNGTP
jgi:hypothetical protein